MSLENTWAVTTSSTSKSMLPSTAWWKASRPRRCSPSRPRPGRIFPGTEEQRIAILDSALARGIQWVDPRRTSMKPGKAWWRKRVRRRSTSWSAGMRPPRPAGTLRHGQGFCWTRRPGQVLLNDLQPSDALQLIQASLDLKDGDVEFSIMGLGQGGDWTRLRPVMGQAWSTPQCARNMRSRTKAASTCVTWADAWQLLEYDRDSTSRSTRV